MRPRSPVHEAIVQTVGHLSTPERGPTSREIKASIQVQMPIGSNTVRHYLCNMVRSGCLVIVRERREDYRNRPVSEYGLPASNKVESPWGALGAALTGWHGGELRTDSPTSSNDAPCG